MRKNVCLLLAFTTSNPSKKFAWQLRQHLKKRGSKRLDAKYSHNHDLGMSNDCAGVPTVNKFH